MKIIDTAFQNQIFQHLTVSWHPGPSQLLRIKVRDVFPPLVTPLACVWKMLPNANAGEGATIAPLVAESVTTVTGAIQWHSRPPQWGQAALTRALTPQLSPSAAASWLAALPLSILIGGGTPAARAAFTPATTHQARQPAVDNNPQYQNFSFESPYL